MKRYSVTLHNDKRTFSAFSSHPQLQLTTPGAFERLVILMHGFPDNNESYNEIAPLVARHFAKDKVLVVAPLLRGYEQSSIGPQDEYAMADVALDVKAWILLLVPEKQVPVHLVGHDWGAIVAFKTASLYPDLVTSMVTMAIPYLANLRAWQLLWYAPRQLYCLSYMLTMQLLFFYATKFGDVTQPGYLDQLWRCWSPGWEFGDEIASVRRTLAEPGVLDATTAYYRNLVTWKHRHHLRWLVDFGQVPTLILGGDQDGCMLAAVFELEAQLLAPVPKVKVQLLSGVGHFLHREDPGKVGELVCDWFEKYDGGEGGSER